MQLTRVRTNGVTFSCAVAGEGPLVLLLHGFPEDHRSWEPVIPGLVGAGLRVVAPDLRGYGATERPPSGYDLQTLTDDVRGLAAHFLQEEGGDGPSGRRVRVVGHDWGGVLTWAFAHRHPDVLARAAVLNGPHPRLFVRRLLSRRQLRKSWYMAFFQLPKLPEAWLRRGGLEVLWRGWGAHRAAFPQDAMDALTEMFAQPDALRGPLAWYRSAARQGLGFGRFCAGVTDAELLVLWGERDGCLEASALDGIQRHAHNVRIVRFPDAGHWLHREATPRVLEELIGFLEPKPGQNLDDD